MGKTSDKIWAVPGGLFVASPGSLVPAISTVGYTPTHVIQLDPVSSTLDSLRKDVEDRVRKDKSIKVIVIDDFSPLAHRTARIMGKTDKDLRQVYQKFRTKADEIFDAWRGTGLSVIVDCHECAPTWQTNESGQRIGLDAKGRPDIPGKKSADDLVKAFDLCFRVEQVPFLQPWPYMYRAGPFGPNHEHWETKDRWNVVPQHSSQGQPGYITMNLGEILRSIKPLKDAGIEFQRAPGCEWMEDLVAWAADGITKGAQAQVSTELRARLQDKPDWQIRWIARDIKSRVEILKTKTREAVFASLGF